MATSEAWYSFSICKSFLEISSYISHDFFADTKKTLLMVFPPGKE